MRRIAVPAAVALALLVAGAAPGLGGQLSAAAPNRASLVDFNGDGFDDLAVGAPGETVGGAGFAGAVDVFYGTSTGLPATQSAELYQNNPEANDAFGSALAAGNFGYEDSTPDLAVGAPGETVGAGAAGAGAVSVWYAFGGGVLTPGPAFTQGSSGLGGRAEPGDAFGAALE